MAILLLLLVVDLIFIVLAGLLKMGWLSDQNLSLGRDRAYPEIFQYFKLAWVMLAFGYLGWRWWQPMFAVIAVLFGYLLLDDAAMIHERGGGALAARLGFEPALGLRAKDFGEMLVSGFAGAAMVGPGWLAWRRSDHRARHVTLWMAAGLLLLAFFGIAVDMLQMMVDITGVNYALKTVEDGGEMMAMSLIAVGTLVVVRHCRQLSRPTAPPSS